MFNREREAYKLESVAFSLRGSCLDHPWKNITILKILKLKTDPGGPKIF